MHDEPEILTTTVGSYPIPAWLAASPSEQGLVDATRVVFDTQRQAGIDLPTDGELYRFDADHPETNGMIDYFVSRMAGVEVGVGRSAREAFARAEGMGFRRRPAGAVVGPLGEGALDLASDCGRAAAVAAGPFKFTVTSPYMLARTLLDQQDRGLDALCQEIAAVLAAQVRGLPCSCVQVDEAHLPGRPGDAGIAARAINAVLDACDVPAAVHLCFGNYGGQTIQRGTWRALVGFLGELRADHVVLELAHRPVADLEALRDIDPRLGLGLGVVDVKVNRIETADEIARALERAEQVVGRGRIRYVHPDCGFWMLARSVADRKIAALAAGRDAFLGR